MKDIASCFLFFLMVIPLTADSELIVGGFADTLYSSSFQGDITAEKTRFHPELEVYAGDLYFNATLNIVGDGLIPANTGFSLKEAYAEYSQDRFDFRLGRQIVCWGRADGIQITDIVSPKDRTELIGQEYEDTRLPVDALTVRTFDTIYTLEGLWIPLSSSSKLPVDPDNPLNEIYFPESGGPYSFQESNRSSSLDDGEWGVRGSLFLSLMDLSFSFFNGWDRDIRYEYSYGGGTTVLTEQYGRITMTGLDMALPLGDFVFRGEAAWFGGRHFAGGSGYLEENQIKALAGIDWNPGQGWMFTGQFYEDIIIDYSHEVARDQREPAVTLSLSRNLLRDTLELAGDLMVNLNDRDSAFLLRGHYDLNDSYRISLGSNLYVSGPDAQGVFGTMEDLSSLWLRGRFSF